jgi:dCTP deaminase
MSIEIQDGILPDHQILRALSEGLVCIDPFDERRVQPASYDLTLHSEALRVVSGHPMVDLRSTTPSDYMEKVTIKDGYLLHPGSCLLTSTLESISLGPSIVARVEGKSTLGRLFLSVHITAGFIDPGWNGRITLEMVNHGPLTIVLWPGMKIAQLSFTKMSSESQVPYGSPKLGSHYQGQVGVVAAAKWG